MFQTNSFRGWAIFAALILISQVLFLVTLAGMERLTRPAHAVSPKTMSLYMSDEPITEVPKTKPILVKLDAAPAFNHVDPERLKYSMFQHRFQVEDAEASLGLYMLWSRRITEVQVNGEVLRSQTPVDFWATLGGFEPMAYLIPDGILKPGENELLIRVNGRSQKILPQWYLASSPEVLNAIGWGRLFSVYLNVAAIAAFIVLILICVTARWPRQDKRRMLGLTILLCAWTIRNLTFLGIDGVIPGRWQLAFHFSITFLFLISIMNFAALWTNLKGPWLRISAGLAIALLAFIGILELLPLSGLMFFKISFWTETILTLTICVIGTLLLARYYAERKPPQFVEPLLFLVAFASVFYDAVDDQWDIHIPFAPDLPLTFYSAPGFGLLLGLGLCATFAAQATATRNLLILVNEELEARVAAQTAELEKSYETARTLERQQAQDEERRRILRDMHDGVGSLLLGLAVQIKAGRIGLSEIGDGIQKGIDDLRLMVTAMDSVEDDLQHALGAFRERVKPQLDAAEIELEWQINLPEHADLPPRYILNIYRILQEAITNVIRHSEATGMMIALHEDANRLYLRITDNGKGYDPDNAKAGRGLYNMKRRARALNAEFEQTSSASGTTICLNFPMI